MPKVGGVFVNIQSSEDTSMTDLNGSRHLCGQRRPEFWRTVTDREFFIAAQVLKILEFVE
jgi:hypothetical protein